MTVSLQSSHCSPSRCYHPRPSHPHFPPVLLLRPPKWTPYFCPYLYSLITAWEPEQSFHIRSQTMFCLCLEFPDCCLMQSKAQSLYIGLQGPTWSLAQLFLWPHPLPLTPSITLLQPPWCLHCCMKIQTHSCITVLAPAIPSTRKAVPSNICMTSRPLLITLYKNGTLFSTYPPGNYWLIDCLLDSCPPPSQVLSVSRGHEWILPVLCTAVSPTPGIVPVINVSVNVLEWMNESTQ